MPTALLVGRHVDYLWQLPPMLAAAGYTTDLVSPPSEFFTRNRHLREVVRTAPGTSLFDAALTRIRERDYDWVIVVDNRALRDIAMRIDVDIEERMRLAPVTGPEHLGHLSSKAGLARRLEAAGFPAPTTAVAHDTAEAVQAADEIGYPVMVKLDASAAGRGTVIAERESDITDEADLIDGQRLVVQEFLTGREWSMLPIFRGGHMVHCLVTLPLDRRTDCGEWTAMRALPASACPDVIDEVRELGSLLGLDGFANITAREDAAGVRRYFEADARPTVWSTRGAEVGQDPVAALSGKPPTDGEPFDLVYFPRLTREELAANRFGVWEQIPREDPEAALLLQQMLSGL